MLFPFDVEKTALNPNDVTWLRELFGQSTHWHAVVGLRAQESLVFDVLLLNSFGDVYVLWSPQGATVSKADAARVAALVGQAHHVLAGVTAHRIEVYSLQVGGVPENPDAYIASLSELANYLANKAQKHTTFDRLNALSRAALDTLRQSLTATHVATAKVQPAAPDEFKAYQCAQCGTGVNANIAHWCRMRPAKFRGRVYCAPCQGSIHTDE